MHHNAKVSKNTKSFYFVFLLCFKESCMIYELQCPDGKKSFFRLNEEEIAAEILISLQFLRTIRIFPLLPVTSC